MRSDFKDIVFVFIIWAITTAIGYAVILLFTPFPVAAAEEAHLIDEAFTVLTLFAVPVFTFVIVILVYGALKFRVKGEPTEDGPPERGQKPLILTWFAASTALTAVLIIFPGVTGILELRHLDEQPADVVVQLEAMRFRWIATYPEEGVFSRDEMVLPVDEHARFNITSRDVLHSFWVPAFRIKIDAVPGMVTHSAATPNLIGQFGSGEDGDVNFRVQCAEMCGVDHNNMRMPVRVVERDDFEAWIAEQRPIRQ